MANRTKLVAGNWKMNGLRADGLALAGELAQRARAASGAAALGCDLLVCPPATLLVGGREAHRRQRHRAGRPGLPRRAAKGAFTGDISAEMLADSGCTHVILGHSERRHGHGETDAEIRAKIAAARRAGLVADPLRRRDAKQQRQAGEAVAVVIGAARRVDPRRCRQRRAGRRLRAGLGDRHRAERDPRRHRADACGDSRAPGCRTTRILYGGSVNPTNAAAILALADVDGALVGGASLDAEMFWAIARCCR